MKENHFLDDGAYSAVQIIIETVRRRLAGEGDIAVELLKDLKEPKDASEFRMKITVIHLSLLCLRSLGVCMYSTSKCDLFWAAASGGSCSDR